MRVIRVEGDPVELGRSHGRAFARGAHDLFRCYCGALKIPQERLREGLQRMEDNMAAVCPDILEELRGIADGAGMAYQDVLLLNGSVEFGAIDDHAHCTNVAFAGTPHGVLHGHNHDVAPSLAVPFVVAEHARPDCGEPVKRVVWTGTVWTAAAVNAQGLTSSVADVWVTDTNWDHGIPINTLTTLPTRRCATVDEAVELLNEIAPINFGYNFLLTDASSKAAVVERSPTRCGVRYLEGRALWSTNHFCLPEMREVMAAPAELLRDSHDRWERLETIVADSAWPWDMDGLQMALRDHAQPGGLCQHSGPGQAGMYTSHSHIMVPAQFQLLIADGLPCRYPYLPTEAWVA